MAQFNDVTGKWLEWNQQYQEFCRNLEGFRKKRNASYLEVAEALGRTEEDVKNHLCGKTVMPFLDALQYWGLLGEDVVPPIKLLELGYSERNQKKESSRGGKKETKS